MTWSLAAIVRFMNVEYWIVRCCLDAAQSIETGERIAFISRRCHRAIMALRTTSGIVTATTPTCPNLTSRSSQIRQYRQCQLRLLKNLRGKKIRRDSSRAVCSARDSEMRGIIELTMAARDVISRICNWASCCVTGFVSVELAACWATPKSTGSRGFRGGRLAGSADK